MAQIREWYQQNKTKKNECFHNGVEMMSPIKHPTMNHKLLCDFRGSIVPESNRLLGLNSSSLCVCLVPDPDRLHIKSAPARLEEWVMTCLLTCACVRRIQQLPPPQHLCKSNIALDLIREKYPIGLTVYLRSNKCIYREKKTLTFFFVD